ncbi:MAG TPA: hypothetical protein PKL65_09625 [Bacteroidales bacterium]|jgi:hypothetical protein|nr:hypothetical protein [Bacteroidales bacterium]HNR42481.1 hypothetical protein [Bacteroidales bacterium]HPM19238.1 hypothetical protein [Bacteroidales bacterium]HQG76357.1 hypothetical protein [Bacteroidales bacterium]
MKTETGATKTGGKLTIIVIAVLVILFLVYYSVMAMLAPLKKLNELKEKYTPEYEEAASGSRILTDSTYLSLIKEKAFLQSKINMAETDSIYLVLNLADSIASLEISGVEVHSARISFFRMSSILGKGNEYLMYSLLSGPLNIVGDYSTIRKEPLMIKMAPRDTSEYKPDIIPDTTYHEPVNYILETDIGIRIFIYQSEKILPSDRKHQYFFDLNDRLRNTWNSLKRVAILEVPEYHPFIKLVLPGADARIIYRAIPRKGQIAVYL